MSAKKAQSPLSSETVELYDKLIATNPNIPRKGATVPYTSLNGNMFSFLSKSGSVGLRLDQKNRELFLEKYHTTLCVEYGIILKEYVLVPPALLQKTKELKKYFDLGYAYAASLKPKPTKKGTKSAGKKK